MAVALLSFAWAGDDGPLQNWGSITLFHLDVPMRTPQPVSSLEAVDFHNVSLALYPTDTSGSDGMIPGDPSKGLPLIVPLHQGVYAGTDATAGPIEFDLINSQVIRLPKAPGQKLGLVTGVLYSGSSKQNCTGVVQIFERKNNQLVVTDQISYDCRGGGSAIYDAHKRRLKIQSARYAAGDRPCCPSLFDKVDFKMNGESMKATNIHLQQQ
jgi:hypothetical protein